MSALPEEIDTLPDLEDATAEQIIGWAAAEFGADLAVASSMQDGVVVDLVSRIAPGTEIAFLDTGFHFDETLETLEKMRVRYPNLSFVSLTPPPDAAIYSRDGFSACCAARKVRPLDDFLAGKRAWISGVRRGESLTRSRARAVEWDLRRGIVKVNPLVSWNEDDLSTYVAMHDLEINPLLRKGYDSIGCWPCTQPGTGRAGRWAGDAKLECGLHDYEIGSGARS